MNFRVPDSYSSSFSPSSESEISYTSLPDINQVDNTIPGFNMSNNQGQKNVIQGGETQTLRKDVILQKWKGRSEDFGFYLGRLEARIKKQMAPFYDESIICLDVIDTLPDDKQHRVSEWFEDCRNSGQFSWESLIKHLENEFSDKQAQQSASDLLSRMEQGYHQYFHDFLREFEYRLAQSGGSRAHTALGKSQKLTEALNTRLRHALVSVDLPNPEDYTAWVNKVKEVAGKLENLASYRPKGAKLLMETKLGAPKAGSSQVLDTNSPSIDGYGDIVVSNSALLAAIQGLVLKKGGDSIGHAGHKIG